MLHVFKMNEKLRNSRSTQRLLCQDYVSWHLMNAKIKDKVSSYPGCDSFRYRQQRETLHPHIIPVLPRQATVTSTYLRESILSFYLLLTSIQSTLNQSCFARPQPLVSSTT